MTNQAQPKASWAFDIQAMFSFAQPSFVGVSTSVCDGFGDFTLSVEHEGKPYSFSREFIWRTSVTIEGFHVVCQPHPESQWKTTSEMMDEEKTVLAYLEENHAEILIPKFSDSEKAIFEEEHFNLFGA